MGKEHDDKIVNKSRRSVFGAIVKANIDGRLSGMTEVDSLGSAVHGAFLGIAEILLVTMSITTTDRRVGEQ